MTIEFRTEPQVELLRYMASDEIVAASARVSTGSAGAGHEQLVRALMRERHGVPFEHCVFTWRLAMPIYVARELVRHRHASMSEMSGRYMELKPVFYVPGPDRPLVKVDGSKRMEYAIESGTDDQRALVAWCTMDNAERAWENYRDMLQAGVLPEVARGVLPVNVGTEMVWTTNARSLLNFLSLRVRDDNALFPSKPLVEIEQLARKIEAIFAVIMPVTHSEFVARGRVAP